jgi:SAM-dependent methyltransferase
MRKLSCFTTVCFILLTLFAPIQRVQGTRLDNKKSRLQSPELKVSASITQDSLQEAALGNPQTSENAVADDDAIWKEFAQWVESLPRLPPGERASLKDLYIKHLVISGVAVEEAQRRLALINVLRSKTLDRERIYWDGKHKLDDNPSEPLALVRNAVSGIRPGKALDVAMGNGRHAIYLASLGWDATGYDFSPESIQRALAQADKASVTITAVRATHDTFDFGESRWDLIVTAYPYYETMDPIWPPRLWKATKPGGLVVFQGVAKEGSVPEDFIQLWHPFHLIHCEILDHGEDWFEGSESRTVKIIARKK